MRSVYVAEEGATLRRDGATLQVWSRRERRAVVPMHDVGQLVLMGNVVLTPAVVDMLLRRGVDTVFLTSHGRYLGRLASGPSSNVHVRLAQVRALDRPDFALRTARIVVAGKIANQRVVLLRHARRHGASTAVGRALVAMRAALERAATCGDLDALRGCEGHAAAAYFKVFGDLLRGGRLSFAGRTRRPPTDPVNAMLSLGYTLLANAVEGAVHVVGLDPYVGALHAPLTGRPSLVCDLQEELRAPVVDAMVVAAINHRAFGPDDFEGPTDEEGVTMKRDSLRAFVEAFERRMRRATHHAARGLSMPWRGVVLEQARAFARHCVGEAAYTPFALR